MRTVNSAGPTSPDEVSEPASDGVDQTGSDGAWPHFWTNHYDELVRYASQLLSGDTHAAEDVAQETAIRLWQHPEVLGDGKPLTGWLRTVARNIIIDRVRRRRTRPAETALTEGLDAGSIDSTDHVSALETVSTILAVLSPRHRDVVFEVYVRDRPIAEVAADLGIPVGTVKSRCHTAIHQLRASGIPELARCA